MNALTINDLYNCLKEEIDKGHEDYVVFVTDDEEGNGYHALWYKGETPEDMDQDTREYIEENNHDLCVLKDKNKAYYLG